MAQLTIYLDDDSIQRIEAAAAREKSSVSKWVKTRLVDALDSKWPHGYFELFGSLADGDFSRPAQLDPGLDASRETL